MASVFIIVYVRDHRGELSRILDADARYLGLAAIAQLLYFFANAMTWQKLLEYSTNKSVSLREGLAQILLVNFGKYIPGKIWGLAARGARLTELSFTLDEVGRASILEQFLLLACGFWLALLAAFIAYDNLVFLLLLALSSPAIIFYRYAGNLVRILARRSGVGPTVDKLFESRLGVSRMLGISVGYLLIWSSLAFAFGFFSQAVFPSNITLTTASMHTVALTTGFLAGFVAIFAPGGIGVREGVGAAVLTPLMTLDTALVLMLLFRVWIIFWEMAAAAAVLVYGFTQRMLFDNENNGE